MKKPAPFIVVEGTEGAGKSEQITTVVNTLIASKKFAGVNQIKVPYGPIREILLSDDAEKLDARTKALLNSACFVEQTVVINSEVYEDKAFVCDRWYYTSQAIQGRAEGVGVEKINALNDMMLVLEPDLVIILDAPDEVLDARVAQRAIDGGESNYYDRKTGPFAEMIRGYYRHLDKKNVVLIDQGNLSIKEVAALVEAAVNKFLNENY